MMRPAMVMLLLFVLPHDAWAEDNGKVLFCCDPALLDGQGSCEDLLASVEKELGGLELAVVPTHLADPTPAHVVAATSEAGAACTVWLSTLQHGGSGLMLYTPGTVQTTSEIEFMADAGGNLDLVDAAFRLRSLIAAALFLDVPVIDTESTIEPPPPSDDPEPAIPPHPVSATSTPFPGPVGSPEVHLAKPVRVDWLVVDAGYLLVSFPLEKHLYHGIGLSVGVLLVPRLELFVDAGLSFANRMSFQGVDPGTTIRLENAQYVVGVGIGYHFLIGRVLRFTPLGGIHLGISDSTVQAGTKRRYREANASIWAGFELAARVTDWLSLQLGLAVENLFVYEVYELDEGEESRTLFSLSQLRLDFIAGASLSF